MLTVHYTKMKIILPNEFSIYIILHYIFIILDIQSFVSRTKWKMKNVLLNEFSINIILHYIFIILNIQKKLFP